MLDLIDMGGDDGEPRGKAFEARVADAYRALGYAVVPNVQLPGKQTDLVVRRELHGGPPQTLAVECKDEARPVGNEAVLAFINRIVAHRVASLVTGGALVSASGFTADARAAALRIGDVTLLSWDELAAQVVNVGHRLREMVEAYESSPIFNNYLPLDVDTLRWPTLDESPLLAASVDELVRRLEVPANHRDVLAALFVLADFGAGKTTLLRRFEYASAKAHLTGGNPRVPLFVALRSFRDTQDVTAMLRASFRDAYHQDIPAELLWGQIGAGTFLVLLDGFDEMLDRSDATRRLDLFYSLAEVLRSSSPTVMSSRPSYFVNPGEFEGLLRELRMDEAAFDKSHAIEAKRGPHAMDRLRRRLVDNHRERKPRSSANEDLDGKRIHVIRLRPLSREGVDAVIDRRAPELKTVGATPGELRTFLDRTYDLSDLASRPLLLSMIMSCVLLGELDLAEEEAQYGPSGLYEMFTGVKLDLDLTKGSGRRRGLSIEVRRALAEELAVAMHKQNTLELPLDAFIHAQMRRDDEMGRNLRDSGLNREEIATDFATCSFATVSEDGVAQFIHKSFRGFFLARMLRRGLGETLHPLFSEWLEREVLYFLGGFGPTEPNVSARLWAAFLRASANDTNVRRNALVAFLYTTPVHDTRRIADADVADAEFGRLAFDGTRMERTNWRATTVGELELRRAAWNEVSWKSVQLGRLSVDGGEVLGTLDGVNADIVVLRGASVELDVTDCAFACIESSMATVSITGSSSSVGRWTAEQCQVDLVQPAKTEAMTISELTARCCDIETEDGVRGKITGEYSVVRYTTREEHSIQLSVDSSVVLLDTTALRADRSHVSALTCDSQSAVILAGEGCPAGLLSSVPCGIFGTLAPREALDGVSFKGWGVVDAEPLLGRATLAESGCRRRRGGVVMLMSEEFQAATASGGELSALEALLSIVRADRVVVKATLSPILELLKTQYERFAEGFE